MSIEGAPPALRPVTPIGILAERLSAAVELAAGSGAPPELVHELAACQALAAGLEPYVEQCTSPESPGLAALAERTRAHDWAAESGGGGPALEAEMLSGHAEGQFLKFVVAMTGAQRILEIGMFTGYSALAMAEALGDDGTLVACELDPEVAAFAEESFAFTSVGHRIEVRVGPAAQTLEQLAETGRDFDLIFIDADKPGYHGYLDTVLDRGLLGAGGTICVDNTLLQGEPWRQDAESANGEAISVFNAAVAEDPRVTQVLVPLRDGITLIRRV